MPLLNINGTDYKGKLSFAFERFANQKYGEVHEKTKKKEGGFQSIYLGLLSFEPEELVKFWDCALAYLGDKKPSIEEIEVAIEARIDADGDTLPATQEAYNAIDDAGFFKRKAKQFWKMFEMGEIKLKSKEEKEEFKMAKEMLEEAKAEIKAETTTA